MDFIGLNPKFIQDEKSQMSMILLVFSTKNNSKTKCHIEDFTKWSEKIEDAFKKVFASNNRSLINKFFQDELIMELWSVYMKNSSSHKENI